MKKPIAVTIFLFAIVAANSFGQAMLNLKEYSSLFLNSVKRVDDKYVFIASDEDLEIIAPLSADEMSIDTPLEIALLSICTGVADIRPAKANEMLGSPKQADLKLGAAVFQEMQVLRFLGDTAAVSRHEAVLKFITDRNNATRAEIEAFYRANVRALIAGVVDERINTVSNFIGSLASPYFNYGTLTYNPRTMLFTFKYGLGDRKGEYTANSYTDMYRKIRNNGHFDDDGFFSITGMFFEIPNANNYTNTITAVNKMVTEPITNFFLTPNQTNFNYIKNMLSMFSSKDFISARELQDKIDQAEGLAKAFEEAGNHQSARAARQAVAGQQSGLPNFVSRYGITNVSNISWYVIHRLIIEVFPELDTTTDKSLVKMLK